MDRLPTTMGQVRSDEAVEKQVDVPNARGTQELRHAETEETKETTHAAPADAPVHPSSPVAVPLPVPPVPARPPSETVLTNATLFHQIVSFQDGLPGLLRELKRETRDYGGEEFDLPSAAAKHHSVRAFEMIESFRPLPENAYRRDLNYNVAANVASREGAGAVLRWIMNCPTIEHRLNRKELKDLWKDAVSKFKPGNFSVLELLSEYFTPTQVKKLETNTWSQIRSVELLQWLTERYTISIPTDVFKQAMYRHDDAMVNYWLSHRPEPMPKGTLTDAVNSSSCSLFMKLIFDKERVPDQKERMDLIMRAVEREDFTLLRLLHNFRSKYPFKKAPVKALELAAARGHLELFNELYLHHDDIISARAFALAATNGHLHLLEFIFERKLFEGIPEAMDGAAANGHLDCVRYLHEKRHCHFKATTNAMDSAAANGHFTMVKYLHENRSEGCTAQALNGAVKNGHEEIVTWLIEHRSEVHSAGGLDGLLMAGKISEWLFYREEWKLFNDDAVDGTDHISELMYEAGRKGKMAAVRFIVKTLNREDLLARAYEGAAEIGSVGWLFALNELDTLKKKRVPFRAIRRAVDEQKRYFRFVTSGDEHLDALKWMIMQCEDKDEFSAMREALERLKAQREGDDHQRDYYYNDGQVDLVMDLTRWAERRQPTPKEMQLLRQKYTTGIFSFATRGSAGDWVVEHAVKSRLPRFKSWDERRQALEDPPDEWTLPKRAVVRNDLTVLHYCRELSQFSDCAEAADFRVDESVLRAGIATARLDVVKWYLSGCGDDSLETPNLLEGAVTHGHPEVAEWLLAHYPQCCTDVFSDRFDVRGDDVDARIFDWFDRLEQDHPELVQYLKPLNIAYDLVGGGNVDLLERFMNKHPELRAHLTKFLTYACYRGDLHAIKYMCGEMEKRLSPNGGPMVLDIADHGEVQNAMSAAAAEGKLEVVEFLFNKFPGYAYLRALGKAAECGHLRVLRYLLKTHFPTRGDWIHGYEHPAVQRLAYMWRMEGAEHL